MTPRPTFDDLLALVRALGRGNAPEGVVPVQVRIYFNSGPPLVMPVWPQAAAPAPAEPAFVPTAFQQAILEALDGVALRTDPLGAAVGDRGRLFKPGGLKGLRDQGMVDHHDRLGYYRPDAPPPELEPG